MSQREQDTDGKKAKKQKMSEPETTTTTVDDVYELYFDGGSRGNGSSTSIAAGGFSINVNNVPRWQGGVYLGRATNNEAEYTGLKSGLAHAAKVGIKKITCRGDSLLVINQMNKTWQIKNERMKLLHKECTDLSRSFTHVIFNHIPRDQNAIADSVANRVMNLKESFVTKVSLKH